MESCPVRQGLIYKLTSPKNKSYIGQTKRDFDVRWKQHINMSKYDNIGCRALSKALRKYGPENFTTECIKVCPVSELDEWEIKLIEEHATLYPDGYNLTKGGQCGIERHTEEEKDKISAAQRKKYDGMHSLPRYVQYMVKEEDSSDGYLVNIPNIPSVNFCCGEMALEEKYEFAIRYLVDKKDRDTIKREYENLKNDRRRNKISKSLYIDGELFLLPCHIIFITGDRAFLVKKPKYKNKQFGDKRISWRANFNKAINYLESLK